MLKLMLSLKKFFLLLVTGICLLSLMACQKEEFRSDTIYLFWQPGCSHCHHAINFFNNELSTVRVEMIDVSKKEGYEKLMRAIKKFKLGNEIATPLFVVKDKTVMGWSNEIGAGFKKLGPAFQK